MEVVHFMLCLDAKYDPVTDKTQFAKVFNHVELPTGTTHLPTIFFGYGIKNVSETARICVVAIDTDGSTEQLCEYSEYAPNAENCLVGALEVFQPSFDSTGRHRFGLVVADNVVGTLDMEIEDSGLDGPTKFTMQHKVRLQPPTNG